MPPARTTTPIKALFDQALDSILTRTSDVIEDEFEAADLGKIA